MDKIITTEKFIEKAKKIHSDRYDYSKVVYVDAKTKVKIICKEHGEFEQIPGSHTSRGSGCKKCSNDEKSKKRKYLASQNFIKKSNEKHNNFYSYHLVNYIDSSKKVKITCPIHGVFEQKPSSHSSGAGCYHCGIQKIRIMSEKKKRLAAQKFTKEANEKHKNFYSYDLTIYDGNNKKVKIICPIHGEFEQTPSHHLNKRGCKLCGRNRTINSLTKTIESFIKECKKIHGDKYKYSKVKYINSKTKVKIICPMHGEFEQTPSDHLSSYGCFKCGVEKRSKKRILTTEKFIEKGKKIHGERYDYSKVNYVNARTKVKIICKKHGEFEQTPYIHTSGHNCPKCARKDIGRKRTATTEEFVKKAKELYGNKFNYDEVIYVRSKEKVIIKCNKENHGKFLQTPKLHLRSNGCPKCALLKRTLPIKKFIKKSEKTHGKKYSYDKVDYKNNYIKVKIFCNIHKEYFSQTPGNHMSGQGCNKCGMEKLFNSRKLTIKEFIKRSQILQIETYNYSKTKYVSAKEKVEIICKKHGSFFQLPDSHLRGSGCPKCGNNNISETILFNQIKEAFPDETVIQSAKLKWLKRQHLDIYFPTHKIGIEFHGAQHFRPIEYFGGEEAFKKIKNVIKEKNAYVKKIIVIL